MILEHLKANPCVDCGEPDPVVLEFDHVRGRKVDDISVLATNGCTKKLVEEMKKCDVRCANCHRRITAEREGRWRFLVTRNEAA